MLSYVVVCTVKSTGKTDVMGAFASMKEAIDFEAQLKRHYCEAAVRNFEKARENLSIELARELTPREKVVHKKQKIAGHEWEVKARDVLRTAREMLRTTDFPLHDIAYHTFLRHIHACIPFGSVSSLIDMFESTHTELAELIFYHESKKKFAVLNAASPKYTPLNEDGRFTIRRHSRIYFGDSDDELSKPEAARVWYDYDTKAANTAAVAATADATGAAAAGDE